VLLAASPAPAEVEITFDPAMVRGPADAPVTIIEFADYQ
jgi:protein-disulfide isomerase